MKCTTRDRDARADALTRGRTLAEIAEPLHLNCADLAHHDDVIQRAGIPADAFRFHAADDLDPEDPEDRCFCYEPVADPYGWDAEARREQQRRCAAPLTLRRPGFSLVVCCRCYDSAGADDAKLAEAARLVARTMRRVEAARRPLELAAGRTRAELVASRALAPYYSIELIAKAGRVLHEVTR